VILDPVQPITPIVVKVSGEYPKDIGVIDIIFGALGITGLILAGSLLLGLLLGALFIWFRNRQAGVERVHSPGSAYGFTPSSLPSEPTSRRRE
jgi:hypothetical protein